MKKLLNRLSNSGKIDVDSLREDTYSDEEHLETHIRKPESLANEPRDSSQDIKLKKSFSGGGSREISKDYDFSPKKKSSSSGIKKDKNDKEKLNESGDKSIRKSSSLRVKSSDKKKEESMRSPSLKSIFVSSYEHQRDTGFESSDSEDDSVPRSRGNSMNDDEFYTTTPIRVPSAPGRMAVSPVPFTPPHLIARAASPRSSPPAQLSPQMAYSPPASPFHTASSPNAYVPSLPRSVSSPAPSTMASSPHVVMADEFDARFGPMSPKQKSDGYETKLGNDFESRDHAVSALDDSDDDVEMTDDGELMNQKGKGGLFSRSNKPKKLK